MAMGQQHQQQGQHTFAQLRLQMATTKPNCNPAIVETEDYRALEHYITSALIAQIQEQKRAIEWNPLILPLIWE
jgi:hypothetical protein